MTHQMFDYFRIQDYSLWDSLQGVIQEHNHKHGTKHNMLHQLFLLEDLSELRVIYTNAVLLVW